MSDSDYEPAAAEHRRAAAAQREIAENILRGRATQMQLDGAAVTPLDVEGDGDRG
jgi:hypothetical protein